MQRARSAGTGVAIPAVTVARDPRIDAGGKEVNAGYAQEEPGGAPARKEGSDLYPGVHAGKRPAARVYRSHGGQSLCPIHLREACVCFRRVEVEKLDSVITIEALSACHTGAAERTLAVVKYGEVGHKYPLRTR